MTDERRADKRRTKPSRSLADIARGALRALDSGAIKGSLGYLAGSVDRDPLLRAAYNALAEAEAGWPMAVGTSGWWHAVTRARRALSAIVDADQRRRRFRRLA